MAVSTQGIWEEFGSRLRLFILKRVHDEHDAEDILQDVFYRIHSSARTLRDEDRLEAWIYQVVRNRITDYYRDRGKVTITTPEMPEGPIETPITQGPIDDLLSCLRPMIDDLPENYRQAIILTSYEGLTQKEIAEKLGLSLSGAKSRVQRARARLKEMLLACCHFEFDRLGNILDYQPREQACRYCQQEPAGR